MTIKVRFFASLRDATGSPGMELSAAGLSTVADVWAAAAGDMMLPGNTLAAINMEYVAFAAVVADGDEVAFFPPVTGGSR